MEQTNLVFPSDHHKVPQWIIDLLEKNFPLRDVLRMEDQEGLYFQKGIHHVIEFLRARSENPNG